MNTPTSELKKPKPYSLRQAQIDYVHKKELKRAQEEQDNRVSDSQYIEALIDFDTAMHDLVPWMSEAGIRELRAAFLEQVQDLAKSWSEQHGEPKPKAKKVKHPR